MNLRPLDKSKHIAKSYFSHRGATKAQRMQEDNLIYRNNQLNQNLGLPAINEKIAKINFKLENSKRIRSLTK
jgi:hypothetical protein